MPLQCGLEALAKWHLNGWRAARWCGHSGSASKKNLSVNRFVDYTKLIICIVFGKKKE